MRNLWLTFLVLVFVFEASLPVDSVAEAPRTRPQTTPPPMQVEHPQGPRVPEPKPSGLQSVLRWLFLSPSAGIEDYREGRFSAAFAAFLRGYGEREHSADNGFNLALTAHRLGLLDKAEGLWRKFITSSTKANPAFVHYNLGNALVASGKLDGALAAFQRALELDPNLGQAARNLRYTQKLKAHLDRKAQQSKQQQNGQKNQQQQDKKQDQNQQSQQQQQGQNQKGQKDQQQKGENPQQNTQQPNKDGKNEAQDPRDKDRAEDSSKSQDKNSNTKDDKDQSSDNNNGDNKDGPSKDKGRSQRKKAWQQQKSLNQRNSERLLESIEEDRKNYLKRRLRPSSRDQSGGKTW